MSGGCFFYVGKKYIFRRRKRLGIFLNIIILVLLCVIISGCATNQSPHQSVLDAARILSGSTITEEQLSAIDTLLLEDSAVSLELLRLTATSNHNPYVRETAVRAIAQRADKAAVKTIQKVARDDNSITVQMAALNELDHLYEVFPPFAPPRVELNIVGPVQKGSEFRLAIRVQFEQPHSVVKMRVAHGKLFELVESINDRIKFTPEKDQVLQTERRFRMKSDGTDRIWLRITISNDLVESKSYEFPIWITLEGGRWRYSRQRPNMKEVVS